MNLRGGDRVRVTRTPRSDEEFPFWSPDGEWIAYSGTTRSGVPAAFLVHPDGTDRHRITPLSLRAGSADWAPDGGTLLVDSNLDRPNSRIYTIRRDGTGLRRLTNPTAGKNLNDFLGSYSPDGRRITFTSDRYVGGLAQLDIWTMNADGTGLRRLTHTPVALEAVSDWGVAR
jgi:TolB protein